MIRSMEVVRINLVAGWVAMLIGVVVGAAMGLFFHHEEWLGGYGSFRRRMLRLGHISLFGLGFMNVLFALSVPALALPTTYARIASASFLAGAITMPGCCFLTVFWKPLRHLFPVPVGCVLVGILAVLIGRGGP
jgi:hypothetical protein